MKRSHDHTQLKRLAAISLVLMFAISALAALPAASAEEPVTAEMKTYGICIPPDGIVNGTMARTAGGYQGEGLGYLYAMLMQHSNVKYVTWAEVQAGDAGVDCTIFWDCRWLTDAAFESVLEYMETNSCLFYGEAPFRYDYEGSARTGENYYMTTGLLLEWGDLVGVKRYQSIDTREGANRVLLHQDVGDLTAGRTLTYPVSGSQWTNGFMVNDELDGAVRLAEFITAAGLGTGHYAMAGRDHGDVRHGVITGLVGSKPQNAPFIYEMARWVADDSFGYNINLWPEGRPFATFERFDDSITLDLAEIMYELDIPHVATINTNGIGEGVAEFIAAHPDYPGLIGLHGNNHTYAFFGSNDVTAEEFAANILANIAYVDGLVPTDRWTWSSPGYNKGANLAAGLELTPVEYAVGMNPLENLPFVTGYKPYDAGIIPYQFPFAASRSSAWYSLINYASFEASPWRYYNLTGAFSLYDYAESCLLLDYHHVQDFATVEEMRAELEAEWGWKKANRDLWCARPDVLLDWYVARLDLAMTLAREGAVDTIALTNGGATAMTSPGVNIATSGPVKSVKVDGRATDNFRYSDGRLFVWVDRLGGGETLEISIEYGEPSGKYALCRDPNTGALSPQIGSDKYYIVNEYGTARSFTFTTLPDGEYVLLSGDAVVAENITAANGTLALTVDPGRYVLMTEAEYGMLLAISPLYAIIPVVVVLGVLGGLITMVGRIKF